jgi:peptidoglycan DL-endopeptidase CwlO
LPCRGLMLAVAMLGQQGCGEDAALPTGPVNATAHKEIPAKLLPIFQHVGAQQKVYWQVLAGVSKEECTFGNDSDPSCTIRWHGTGLGPANGAGAAGLMQIGIGGAAGNEWGQYGTDGDHNGHKDPHDPFDGIPCGRPAVTGELVLARGRPAAAIRVTSA